MLYCMCRLFIRMYLFTHTGMAVINNNGIATVTVDGLQCEVTYDIIAGGTLNGALVGPRSSHGSITSGPCLADMPIPSVSTPSMNGTSVATPSMNGKEEICT